MKRQYTVAALLLSMSMVLTGCSWEDIKAKFVGGDAGASNSSIQAEDEVIDIEDYNVEDCITLGEYRGIEVDCTVSDDELQEQLDTMLMQYSTVEEIKTGKCKSGQSVNIDYTGEVDGKEVDGQTAQDEMIQLGSSGHIDGFDDGIVGMKPGKKKELTLTFPDDYEDSDLAGKNIVYTIKLNYIAGETKTPKLTEKFVKNNTSYKSVAECKKETKEALVEQKKNSAVDTALGTAVDNSTVISIPETLKEAHKRQTDHSYRYSMAQYYGATDFETILGSMGMTSDVYEQQLEAAGEESAKMQLVIEAISLKENLTSTEADVNAYVDEVVSSAAASGAEATRESFEQQYIEVYGESISFEDFLVTSCLYQKVLDLIESTMKIKE